MKTDTRLTASFPDKPAQGMLNHSEF